MVPDKSKTPSIEPTMKVQKWLSLGEAYVTPRLKRGSKTLVSGDKVIGSLKTHHLATQIHQDMYGAKGVKHQISMIWRGDKE